MDERPNCKKFSKEKVFTFVFSLKEVIWTNKCFRYNRWYSLCHIKGTFGVTIVSYYLRLSIYHNVQIWQTRHRWEPFIWNMRYVQSFPNVLTCFIIPGRFHEYMYTGKQWGIMKRTVSVSCRIYNKKQWHENILPSHWSNFFYSRIYCQCCSNYFVFCFVNPTPNTLTSKKIEDRKAYIFSSLIKIKTDNRK